VKKSDFINLAALGVSAITLFVFVFTATHDFFFTRKEGEDLGKRVERLETQWREDFKDFKNDIKSLVSSGRRHSRVSQKNRTNVAHAFVGPVIPTIPPMEAKRKSAQEFWLESFDDPTEPPKSD
jgi:hypothetical protein